MSAHRSISAAERAMLEALRNLRYGSIEAIVHDGRIVRIERTEKLRLEDDPTAENLGDPTRKDERWRPDSRSALQKEGGERPCRFE